MEKNIVAISAVEERIKCPCQAFNAMSKIDSCLTSKEQVDDMIRWLEGDTDRIALKEGRLLSCGKRSRCRFRYGTSFAILNSIRDACRPFLEPSTQSAGTAQITDTTEKSHATTLSLNPVPYEDAFPALSNRKSTSSNGFPNKAHPAASNILVPRKKPKEKKVEPAAVNQVPEKINKAKRRIRPQPASSIITTNSVWGGQHASTSTTKLDSYHRNIANLPSQNPLTPVKKIHIEEKKIDPVLNQVKVKEIKAKRRIQPQIVSSDTSSNTVWGQQVATSTAQLDSYDGKITNLPSQNPLTPAQRIPIDRNKNVFEARFCDVNTESRRLFVDENTTELPSETPRSGSDKSTSIQNATIFADKVLKIDGVKEAPKEQVQNLVNIYIALIKNMLIPSTPLELHLLIRLLAIDAGVCTTVNKSKSTTSDGSDMTQVFFQSIFSTPDRCKFFASTALCKLKPVIRNLGVPLITAIIQCNLVRMACPGLVEDLKLVQRIRGGLLPENAPEDVTGTHAMLSLPFEEERDSRHKYRTQAEMAVYKNREQSRDTFLYQLRAYMNIKGKGFQAQNMEKARGRLQEESRKITNGLFIVNMPWFAEFVCDLLLQVGLSPVEETDQELLSIADKGKLQKLHKRFSSRSYHANKSSKKLVLSSNRSNSASALSPLAEAQVYFSGYQEFFFIFLHSADNYNLSIHLRNRMVATIIDLSSNHSTSKLERRLTNLQLFARFLGFLIFSPNWHDNKIDLKKLNHDSKVVAISNGLHQLESLGLVITEMVEESWTKGHSILVIPWVIELLKMSKWDSISLTSGTFRQLLSNLRTIQSAAKEQVERFGPSMQLLSFYIESFFHKSVGLQKLTSLPTSSLPSETKLGADSLDLASVGFSMATISASSSHVEDICDLINGFSRAMYVGKSPSKARKLRPSIVRGSLINLEADTVLRESPLKRFSSTSTTIGSDWQSSRNLFGSADSSGTYKSMDSIQRKLEDAFFHQHRSLKDICEFAVNQVIKNTSSQALKKCVQEAFTEQNFGMDSSEQAFDDTQSRAVDLSIIFLRANLESSVRATLCALGPSSLQPKVLDIAISLSVTRGVQSGRALLHTLVLNESKAFLEALKREEKKKMPCKALSFAEEKQGLEVVISSLGALRTYLSESPNSSWSVQELSLLIRAAERNLKAFSCSSILAMPPESDLRRLFDVLFNLDVDSVTFIKWSIGLDDEDFFNVLSIFLQLETQFAQFTTYGLRHISKSIDKEILTRLLMTRPDSVEAIEELARLLKGMIRARIIKRSLLFTCLNGSDFGDSNVKRLVLAELSK